MFAPITKILLTTSVLFVGVLLLVHFIFTTVEYEFSTSCCDVIDMTFETKALRDDRRNVRCSTRLDKMSDIEYQDRPNDNYPAHKQTYCEGLDNQVPRISIVRWNMTDTIVPGVRNMYTFVNMSINCTTNELTLCASS